MLEVSIKYDIFLLDLSGKKKAMITIGIKTIYVAFYFYIYSSSHIFELTK